MLGNLTYLYKEKTMERKFLYYFVFVLCIIGFIACGENDGIFRVEDLYDEGNWSDWSETSSYLRIINVSRFRKITKVWIAGPSTDGFGLNRLEKPIGVIQPGGYAQGADFCCPPGRYSYELETDNGKFWAENDIDMQANRKTVVKVYEDDKVIISYNEKRNKYRGYDRVSTLRPIPDDAD